MLSRVLATDPCNVNALHLLGVLARQIGRYAAAVDLILQGRRPEPPRSELHSNLGNALTDLGRNAEAEAAYRASARAQARLCGGSQQISATSCSAAASTKRPRPATGRCWRSGRTSARRPAMAPPRRRSRPERPRRIRGARLRANPIMPRSTAISAMCFRCRAAWRRRKRAAAGAGARAGLSRRHNNLGSVLKDQGRLAEAEACYRRAITLDPNLAEAHNNLGLVLKDFGQPGEAEACYRRAIALRPRFADALCNLGRAASRPRPDRGCARCGATCAGCGGERPRPKACSCAAPAGPPRPKSSPRMARCAAISSRALLEPWGRPSQLAGNVPQVLKLDPVIAAWVNARQCCVAGRLLCGRAHRAVRLDGAGRRSAACSVSSCRRRFAISNSSDC